MTDETVEERLRDALGAVRDQAQAPPFPDLDVDRPPVVSARDRSMGPRLLAAAAVVVIAGLVGVLLSRGGDEGADVASESADVVAHDELIDRVVAECLEFQAAAPAGPLPPYGPGGTAEELEALTIWQQQYALALDGADDVYLDIVPPAEDQQWVDEALVLLRSQQEHTRRAGEALEQNDGVAAWDALYVAIQFGNQLAFELAQAGATECDVRGVTQPTR